MAETVKTLSATRQRLSIGEISRREKGATSSASKKPVRSTVVNPREIEWPEVDSEGSAEIIALIEKLGKYLKIPHRKPPLNEIRAVEKEERGEFRRKWSADRSVQVGYDISNYIALRSCLVIGVNCVSKALETDALAAAIIEKNVNPPIITKLLIPVAAARNIPMVAVDGLNSAFQMYAGIRCIAVGIKKVCEEDTHLFYPLLAAVKDNLRKAEDEKLKNIKPAEPVSYAFCNVKTPSSSSETATSTEKRSSPRTGSALKPTKIRKVTPQ